MKSLGRCGRLLCLSILVAALVALPIWYGSSKPTILEAISRGDTVRNPVALEAVFPLREWPGSREPWEVYYMYAVSVVGCLWVAVRTVQGFRFDLRRWTFVPRSHHRPLRSFTKRRSRTTAEETERGGPSVKEPDVERRCDRSGERDA
ncbi:hypothetical protein [Natrarchaeobius oligotrophus]|nr:hypothetical protein [Natrarchaeobius chitinivorans]